MGDDTERTDVLWRTVGNLETGVKAVDTKVCEAIAEIKKVGSAIEGKVDKESCDANVERLFKKIDAKQTRPVMPHRTPEEMAAEIAKAINGGKRKSLLLRIKENIVAISVIAAAIASLGYGAFRAAHVLVSVDDHLKITERKQEQLIRASKRPRYIQVQVPVPVPRDAGD
jgi:hypothetical protein